MAQVGTVGKGAASVFDDAAIAAKRAARRRMMADSAGDLTPIPDVPTMARLAGYKHQLDAMTRSALKKAGKADTDARSAIKLGVYRGEEYVLKFRIEDSASPLDGRVVVIRCRVPDLDEKKSAGKSAFRPGAADMIKFFTSVLPAGEPVDDENQWKNWLENLVAEGALLSITFKMDADTNPKTGKVYPYARIAFVTRLQEDAPAEDGGDYSQEAADEAYSAGEPSEQEQEPEPEPEPEPAPAPKPPARKAPARAPAR